MRQELEQLITYWREGLFLEVANTLEIALASVEDETDLEELYEEVYSVSYVSRF